MAEPELAADAAPDEHHERSLAEARALFAASDGSLGSIDEPTKQGFLALARKGAAIWNAWRKTYPHPAPDFSGMFLDGEDVDFSGFNFPNPAAGGACVDFSGSTFEYKNRFYGTIFGDYANFTISRFSGNAVFSKATFGKDANFMEAHFIRDADFGWARFGDGAFFATVAFHASVNFSDSSFSGNCYFHRVTFAQHANFTSAVFSGPSTFQAAAFCLETNFVDVIFGETVDFSTVTSEKTSGASYQFQYASFNGAVFHRRARFTGRQFLAATDFGVLRGKPSETGEPPQDKPTVFMGIPDFHGCKFHQDTSFDGAVFETPLNQEAARAFRTLKLAMEQLKATREEQKFFRLEMKAEHSNLPWGKRWISTLYSLFSDYGFSLWRPLACLLSLSILFGMGYGLLANGCATNTQCADAAKAAGLASSSERTSAIIKYTLASVAPVPGLDKMQTELRAPLFGHHGWVPITALTLEILHKIMALVMVFLFALALRNLFKMKS